MQLRLILFHSRSLSDWKEEVVTCWQVADAADAADVTAIAGAEDSDAAP